MSDDRHSHSFRDSRGSTAGIPAPSSPPLDLDAIRARAEAWRKREGLWLHDTASLIHFDIPALCTEIESLRARLIEAQEDLRLANEANSATIRGLRELLRSRTPESHP